MAPDVAPDDAAGILLRRSVSHHSLCHHGVTKGTRDASHSFQRLNASVQMASVILGSAGPQSDRSSGVPDSLGSCHTAQIGGYVIEGHVPAETIRRLLRERPRDAAGLAVPGMPAGSPGMDTGGQGGHYDVIAFGRDGRTRVYERH